MRKLMLVASIAVLSACRPAATPDKVAEPAAVEAPAPAAPPAAAASTAQPDFASKVWRVQSSSAGELGSTYAFLADGALVIESPHGTPMHGQWRYEAGKLTLVEEGIAYPTDIVKLDPTIFQIRSHNPGGTVDITLVPATDVPLPVSEAGPPPMPGSDRDVHGCIPSAGYSWCARTNRCERPWELAKAKRFANTPDAYDQFCAAPAK